MLFNYRCHHKKTTLFPATAKERRNNLSIIFPPSKDPTHNTHSNAVWRPHIKLEEKRKQRTEKPLILYLSLDQGFPTFSWSRTTFKSFLVAGTTMHVGIIKISCDNQTGRSWRSGTRCDCKTDWLWVRSPLEEMKYLLKFIFPFLRSGVEVKRGVEFCHSTRNASRIRQKVGNGVS